MSTRNKDGDYLTGDYLEFVKGKGGWVERTTSKRSIWGILLLWKKGYNECMDTIEGECSISCLFNDRIMRQKWVVTRVYNRGDGGERRVLWRDLEVYKQRWDWLWVVGRNFNMVLHRHERTSERFSRIYAEEFKEPLNKLDLADLLLMGGKWAWSNQKINPTCPRID